jgi:hypothetical protein
MNNQEIIDNAPEGATHIDGEYDFCKDGSYFGSYFGHSSKQWIPAEFIVESRSLADIKRIIDLEGVCNEYRRLVADLRLNLKEQGE